MHCGPEVRSAQRKLAMQPEPERVAALPFRTQDELLDEIEGLISSLPAGEEHTHSWRMLGLGRGLFKPRQCRRQGAEIPRVAARQPGDY